MDFPNRIEFVIAQMDEHTHEELERYAKFAQGYLSKVFRPEMKIRVSYDPTLVGENTISVDGPGMTVAEAKEWIETAFEEWCWYK